jgi:glycerophosphoryl diester phosphodiesterase
MIYNESDGPLILAHRGGGGEAPENTMEAFQHATELGITHLETDVRATRDGTLYLRHNATSMLPNRPLRPGSRSFTTLVELFDAFPEACFAIDPKHDFAVEHLAKLIVERSMEQRVCIGSSFDARTERTADLIEKLGGTRPVTAVASVSTLTKLLLGAANSDTSQATYIYVPARLVTDRVVNNAHRKGLKVIAWTLNSESDIAGTLATGIDGFMTDYPTTALNVVHSMQA